ncbi:protein kinase [Patescibacteria group bacterium]|nr:protein kinase [Patescibacteria group bacterium]MBP9710367.1 protein kinase [Patescibacteria group bacterium]
MSANQYKQHSAGNVVGGFTIERIMGDGACGCVYKATSIATGETVALKILHSTLNLDENMRQRFLSEGPLITKIRESQRTNAFPYVVAFGHDDVEDVYFLALEFLNGCELMKVIASHRSGMPVAKALGYIMPILLATAAAHAAGVVHRDLKPENIYVIGETDGRPIIKVLDLGIAKDMERQKGDRLTVTGTAMGTPYYMPPEQWRGSGDLGPPSDVFALACILYELLMGMPPFYDTAQHVIMSKVLTMAPDRPLPDTIPPHIREAIMKGLEKDPAKRWQDAHAFLEALEAEPTMLGEGAERRSPTEFVVQPPAHDEDKTNAQEETAQTPARATTDKMRRGFRLPLHAALGALLVILVGAVAGAIFLFLHKKPPLPQPTTHVARPHVTPTPVTSVPVTPTPLLVPSAPPPAASVSEPSPDATVERPRPRRHRDAGTSQLIRRPRGCLDHGYHLDDGACCREVAGGGVPDCNQRFRY